MMEGEYCSQEKMEKESLSFSLDDILSTDFFKRKRPQGRKCLLSPVFGSFSFINIACGKEESDGSGSNLGWRNMVEVAVVVTIMGKLHKAWNGTHKKLSIVIISPFKYQVTAMLEKLGKNYDNIDGFAVEVKSMDDYQGEEKDIVILSTVRSNNNASVPFLSNQQRTNLGFTKARNCLWILGHDETLVKSGFIWEQIVCTTKNCECFYNAEQDEELRKVILEVKKDLDQLDDLFNIDHMVFKGSRWKVLFSNDFKRSFENLKSSEMKKLVIYFLQKISSGWIPKKRNMKIISCCSGHYFRQFKVKGGYIVCSNAIVKDEWYVQVLKIWDILPLENVTALVQRLHEIYKTYTDEYVTRCNARLLEGDLEVPMSWMSPVVENKKSIHAGPLTFPNGETSDRKGLLECSKVSESLLLMKFYSLSSDVARQLLSGCDGEELEIPYELTDQERDVTQFTKSSFVIGRSGTGKTTVLVMKLFKKEQLHHIASQGFHESYSSSSSHCYTTLIGGDIWPSYAGTSVLRQIFVSVSPILCSVVKQHISRLKRSSCGVNYETESSDLCQVDDIDDLSQFSAIPDTFVDLPQNAYPLMISLEKFLTMLDGTVGNSFFDRLPGIRTLSCHRTSKSVVLQNAIRSKKVDYNRFYSSYWPHFSTELKKNLDPSIVFTEIISQIKGEATSTQTHDRAICQDEYISLSESRISTLDQQERENIYNIFLAYENKKMAAGEFDVSDLVMDLHRRLVDQRYKGDEIDFIYIDEVQDITMRQVSLFKYVCRNFEEGFMFCGDTAQTIAKGVNFRFEDIRSLFYREFVTTSRNAASFAKQKNETQVAEKFQLSLNFRTHVGVLKLAQSVIDLLYHFFPYSIDILNPETSFVHGEPPVFLKPVHGGKALESFAMSKSIVGFGAEQVILVRDDAAKNDVCQHFTNQALVLTIVECKGLEFQDVFLYNYFGTSPLKNKWRVLYKYMDERNLLHSASPLSFQDFSERKHKILCTELKQLYVAITRTKQRLFIYEEDESSHPIIDYWAAQSLIQTRYLDDKILEAIQISSSKEQWKSRGIKLFHEHNYKMAKMCFEKACDSYWKKWAEAASDQLSAVRLRDSNPSLARTCLNKAVDAYEAIGKAESAAQCFIQFNEYERAGEIYLAKFGVRKLKEAGECFFLAGYYDRAAETYARGFFFYDCLSACHAGKLFDMGMKFIGSWRMPKALKSDIFEGDERLNICAQKLLEDGAFYYHKLKDQKRMMTFVESFDSKNSVRAFLKEKVCCFNELLKLEIEWGDYWEAVNAAGLKGDLLLEADISKALNSHKDASILIYCFVIWKSLCKRSGKIWPSKPFTEKRELLMKASIIAKIVSSHSADVSSDEVHTLFELQQLLDNYLKHKGTKDELLSPDKILDDHLLSRSYLFDQKDKLVSEKCESWKSNIAYFEESNGKLVRFWNIWKDRVLEVFDDLDEFKSSEIPRYKYGYGEFCLVYFMVIEQFSDVNVNFSLIYPEKDCVRQNNKGQIERKGIGRWFNQAARRYWSAEALSVGMKVLRSLESHHNYSMKNDVPMHSQYKVLVYIFEIYTVIMNSDFLNCSNKLVTLERFQQLAIDNFFRNLFPLDWKESSSDNMIVLREKCPSTMYERAGEIYLDKFEDQKLKEAGECFSLAGCFKRAAETYARGSFFYKCLSACHEGKLFDMGLEFILSWRMPEALKSDTFEGNEEINMSAQKLLEDGALHYHKLKDHKRMMTFVESFNSQTSIRIFLKQTVCCFNELLKFEIEWGDYWEAVTAAGLKGDLLLEADISKIHDSHKDASILIFCFVIWNSLCKKSGKEWPFKPSIEKRELLMEANRIAQTVSSHSVDGSSDEVHTLFELKQLLDDYLKHGGRQDGVLCFRKVLDEDLLLKKDNIVSEKCESRKPNIADFEDSNEKLVRFWNVWKDHVLEVFEYLDEFKSSEIPRYKYGYGEFCLVYFMVIEQFSDVNVNFSLLYPEKDRVRQNSKGEIERKGTRRWFNQAARRYWSSEALTVGMKVMKSLQDHHDFSVKNDLPMYCQYQVLLHIFEISTFIINSNFLSCSNKPVKLEKFQQISIDSFFRSLFPLDWNESCTENMIVLREKCPRNLFEKVTYKVMESKGNLSDGRFMKLMTMILGAWRRPYNYVSQMIRNRINLNPVWLTCFMNFKDSLLDVRILYQALKDAYLTDLYIGEVYRSLNENDGDLENEDDSIDYLEKHDDCISPECFLYLIERLVTLVIQLKAEFFVTRSCFTEWIMYESWSTHPNSMSEVDWKLSYQDILNFVATMTMEILNNMPWYMKKWIELFPSSYGDCYSLLVSRLFMIMCSLYLNTGNYFDLLLNLLARDDIKSKLPGNFYETLNGKLSGCVDNDVTILAEALVEIGNPLVIIGQERNRSMFPQTCVTGPIFIDLNRVRGRAMMLEALRIKSRNFRW